MGHIEDKEGSTNQSKTQIMEKCQDESGLNVHGERLHDKSRQGVVISKTTQGS